MSGQTAPGQVATGPDTAWLHSAFYRFVPLADPVAVAAALRATARQLPGLHGSIVLAAEGISGMVAAAPAVLAGFEAALQQALPSGASTPALHFKHSACAGPPFGRLKVSVKPELVALGLPTDPLAAPLPAPDQDDASHLSPLAWRALLARDDMVLLDNRNHFEYRLGHFRGAVDPKVQHFRDFVAHVQANAPAWRAAGRPVAMYCTGGIRCDKTAPWLRSLGLQVWQLDGGILNYCQELDDARHEWLGECFVFDKRLALDSRLQPTATTAAQVFDAALPDEAWRLQRALRLAKAAPHDQDGQDGQP